VDLDVILYGCYSIEYYAEYILFNHLASTIPKWWTFKFLRWAQILNHMVDLDETLYGGDDVVDDIDSVLLNLVSSAIPEWPTFKLLRLLQTLN
jgi:hypothetical protein